MSARCFLSFQLSYTPAPCVGRTGTMPLCTVFISAAVPDLGCCNLVLQIFVEQLKWLSPAVFLELLGLSQCLPGPTSTQLSFALGVVQKVVPGGLLSGEAPSQARHMNHMCPELSAVEADFSSTLGSLKELTSMKQPLCVHEIPEQSI